MNLIIGLAHGYKFEQIKDFVHSLFEIRFPGKIVLIGDKKLVIPEDYQNGLQIKVINDPAFKRNLFKSAFIKILSTSFLKRSLNRVLKKKYKHRDKGFSPMFENLYHCQTSRYAFYYNFLNQRHYEKILLTDVRDVIFQSDPFNGFHDELAVFNESQTITIKDEEFNRDWIKKGFGENAFAELADKKIYCSGTIMGSYKGIMNFLEVFLMACIDYSIPFNFKGIDQGVFNYLIHTGKLNGIRKHDNGDIIFTACPEAVPRCEYENGMLAFEGKTPSLVHQYDRFPELVNFFNRVSQQ
jgi:hypothetical protein